MIQAGAIGVLVLMLIVIGKFVAPALKAFLDSLITTQRELVGELKKHTEVLDKVVTRLDQHEEELKARRCIYRDRDGHPSEGISGFPRRMAPSVPDGP